MSALAGLFIGLGLWFGLHDLGAGIHNAAALIAEKLAKR